MGILKDPRFVASEDVQRRLDQAVCRYKGRPVWCRFYQRMEVNAQDMLTKALFSVDANDDDLDVSAPPLGYVNVSKTKGASDSPYYFMRNTDRSQKTGIDLSRVLVKTTEGAAGPWGDPVGGLLPHIGATILGEYPDYATCVESVKKSRGMAFHRRMALGIIADIPVVLYRGEAVGLFDTGSNSVMLMKDYVSSPIETALSNVMRITYSGGSHAEEQIRRL